MTKGWNHQAQEPLVYFFVGDSDPEGFLGHNFSSLFPWDPCEERCPKGPSKF